MNLTSAEYALWFVNILFCAILAVKLFLTRLSRRYRYFWIFLILQVVCALTLRTILSLDLADRRRAYALTWAGFEIANWLFCVLVVYELYELVLEKYPGIEILGR